MILLLAAITARLAMSFQSPVYISNIPAQKYTFRKKNTFLQMSDIPRPENEKRKGNRNKKNKQTITEDDDLTLFRLPPPPEDGLIIMGDLLSLFVYGFSDHWICHDLAAVADTSAGSLSAIGGLEAVNAPVWLDASQSFAPSVLQIIHETQAITQYSPLLQNAGMASCVLATCWLFAGWLQGAFLYRNTLNCQTDHALNITARAWILCCLSMAYLVTTTSWIHEDYILHAPMQWNGFTKGDVDYIMDSLSVLALWRWMASSLLGSGGNQ